MPERFPFGVDPTQIADTASSDSGASSGTDPSSGSGPSALTPNPGPTRIAGRYEVMGILGAGGMGRVYLVRDRALDEVVALKLLRRELGYNPAARERFRNEVKLARRVTHPNVVRTFDLGEHEGESFLTMEHIEGEPLSRRLEREGALPIAEAVYIAMGICAGVAAAHAAGVLHQDLKPDNVLLDAGGNPRVTDFGIACVTLAEGMSPRALAGTPAYMAPEQVRGEAITAATDVYAIGAVLHELLTGRPAWVGDDPLALALARLDAPPPDPRALAPVPDALAALVLACMAQRPGDRPVDAAAVGHALEAIDVSQFVAPSLGRTVAASVPGRGSRALAVLPLRCEAPAHAELAEGLTEELVDSLSMTRGLRVRPMASVREVAASLADPRALGGALDVDVIVELVLRGSGERLRLSARALGVADGFQLCAARVECGPEGLLDACDELARRIAGALATELDAPSLPSAAAAPSARAIERYLVGKQSLRRDWMSPVVLRALAPLEEAHRLAPEHPGFLAAYATARARCAFYGVVDGGDLAIARELAERALTRGPELGDAWFALGYARLYDRATADAADAFLRAIERAPGLAEAQAILGEILVEAGEVEEGTAHLEAALRIDPSFLQPRRTLSRVHELAGNHAAADAMIEGLRASSEPSWRFNVVAIGVRYGAWRDRVTPIPEEALAALPRPLAELAAAISRCAATRAVLPEDLLRLEASRNVANPRLRATVSQFVTESLTYGHDLERAFESLVISVESGLEDVVWIDRCPVLGPLREHPRYPELRARVAERAARVVAVAEAARRRREAAHAR